MYRRYITDGLKMISKSAAAFAGGEYLSVGFDEALHPKPVDTRTADEIITGLRKKLQNA